jgi:hypothetical protein
MPQRAREDVASVPSVSPSERLAGVCGAVVAELARRGLVAHHGDCTADVFGAVDLPGRQVSVSGRAERVSIWIEGEQVAWVELRVGDLIASGEIGRPYLRDSASVAWLADLASGAWSVRRGLSGRRTVKTAHSPIRLHS